MHTTVYAYYCMFFYSEDENFTDVTNFGDICKTQYNIVNFPHI